jgi:hypothetical protein
VIAYVRECTDCRTRSRHDSPEEALAAVRGHRCARSRDEQGLLRCLSCGGRFGMLVDDGPLCIRCDAFHFPVSHDLPVAQPAGLSLVEQTPDGDVAA